MIIAGGGTGGHLFPGLAVADALMAQGGSSVLFVGSTSGIEATAVPRTRFPFQGLSIRGLRGRGVRAAASFAWRLPVAVFHAWRIMGTFQPTLVLGLGGYGSVPVVVAAWLRRIPSVLLEQNVRPGLANRLLAHVSRRICTTFAQSAGAFPAGKAVHTGNPVRQFTSDLRPSESHFTIFIFGGSQGAHTINCAAVAAAPRLAQQLPALHIIHQTGAADQEWVRQRYQELGLAVEVLAFVHDMGGAYGRADLVICRAGATTLAELTALGKPSILVPYPFAVDDHQHTNAEVLVRSGAAEIIADAELGGETLTQAVLALARDRRRLVAMGMAARQLAVPDAAARVVDVCRQVAAQGG